MLGLCPGCLLPHTVDTTALVSVADTHFHRRCLLSHIRDWKQVAGGRPPKHSSGLYHRNLARIPKRVTFKRPIRDEWWKEGRGSRALILAWTIPRARLFFKHCSQCVVSFYWSEAGVNCAEKAKLICCLCGSPSHPSSLWSIRNLRHHKCWYWCWAILCHTYCILIQSLDLKGK